MNGTALLRRSRSNNSGLAMKARTISVVVPMKDEVDNVNSLYQRVRESVEDHFDWELICVDDGSSDGTFAALTQLAAEDSRLKVIRLRRNFGQAAAMQAGRFSPAEALAIVRRPA